MYVLYFLKCRNYNPNPICPHCKKYQSCKNTCKELEIILNNLDRIENNNYFIIFYKTSKKAKKTQNIKIKAIQNPFKQLEKKFQTDKTKDLNCSYLEYQIKLAIRSAFLHIEEHKKLRAKRSKELQKNLTQAYHQNYYIAKNQL